MNQRPPPRSFAAGFAMLVTSLLASAAPAAEPFMEKVDVFTAGEGGYAIYRIPGIVVTAKGTILAYCEARKSPGDWAEIDIFLRRSTDGGRTWEPGRKVVKAPAAPPPSPAATQPSGKPKDKTGVTINNPVAIADRSGAVHFLYCVEYARCYYARSDDDGLTFTEPVDVTATFDKYRPEYDWNVIATGPGHGTQLSTGRLLVPVWLSTGGAKHRPSCVSTIYSDDGGKTWHRGEVVANHPDPLVNPSETAAVELSDGRVMLNIRHETKNRRRAVAVSADGATKWEKVTFDEALVEPVCMASLVGMGGRAGGGGGGKHRILFSNPNDPKARKNVTVRLSDDNGKTWAASKAVEPGISGYSDLAAGPDGTIYCLYERAAPGGNAFRNGFLTVARFNVEWLTRSEDAAGR